jgi:L,D-transpeptidase ErfK/SrfK
MKMTMRLGVLIVSGLALGAFCAPPAYAASDLLKFFNKTKPQVEDKANKNNPENIEDVFKGDTAKKAAEKPTAPKQQKTYNRDYVGSMQTYVTKYEDTMIQIARDYNVGFVELRSANPFLDPWIPGDKKKVLIPSMHLLPRAPREGVVINLAEMRMYSFPKSGAAPRTFPIGVGREGLLTPVGTTTVVRKAKDPVWRPTPRMRKENPALPAEVPPGPDNPMGTHALYLGWPTYAIHGTDKPYSIGRRVSAGCIRMYPEDIIKFFDTIPVGTQVTVVDQPVKVGWVGDKLYLEVHTTTEQADMMEISGGLPGYVFSADDMGMIVAAAGEFAGDLNWSLIRQVVRERRGYPVEIFRKKDKKEEEKAQAKNVAGASEDAALYP